MGVKKRRGGKVAYVRNDGTSKFDSAETSTSAENTDDFNIDYLIFRYSIEPVGDKMKLVAPKERNEREEKEIEFLRANKQKILDRIKEIAEAKEKFNKKYDDIMSDNRELVRSLRSVAGSRTVDIVVNDIIRKGLSPEKATRAIKDAIIREKSLRS